MSILLYVINCILLTYAKITIKHGSMAPINPGDIGMIFYFTLENRDKCSYNIFIKMDRCCEQLTRNVKDCNIMQLLGGDMGLLNTKSTKNVTLLYPNMYVLNRKGKCEITLAYTNEQGRTFEASHTIAFNTMVGETLASTGYSNGEVIEACETPDLDPLENCEPVNCQMKYLGCRNYYNQKLKRCQKIPSCLSDPNAELPSLAYIPVSNKCRNLRQAISSSDLKQLEQGVVTGRGWDINSNYPLVSSNLRCHHGKIDNKTGFCICNEGWSSAPFTKENYEPSLSVYHMCNIQIGAWHEMNETKFKTTTLLISLCAVSTTITILVGSFCLDLLYKCLKRFENSEKCDPDECGANKCRNRNRITQTQKSNDEVEELFKPEIGLMPSRSSSVSMSRSSGPHSNLSKM